MFVISRIKYNWSQFSVEKFLKTEKGPHIILKCLFEAEAHDFVIIELAYVAS